MESHADLSKISYLFCRLQRKVSGPVYSRSVSHLIIYRILLASIHDRGLCPCPRCLIPLERVPKMGMARDMRQRVTLARVDDDANRRKVETARDIIYKKNYAVDSAAVEAILKGESLVPSSVSGAMLSWLNLKARK